VQGKVNRADPTADHEGLEMSLASFLQVLTWGVTSGTCHVGLIALVVLLATVNSAHYCTINQVVC
jgi:hypothetical protein